MFDYQQFEFVIWYFNYDVKKYQYKVVYEFCSGSLHEIPIIVQMFYDNSCFEGIIFLGG